MNTSVAYYHGTDFNHTARVFKLNDLDLFRQDTWTVEEVSVSELRNADGDLIMRGTHAEISAAWEKIVWPIVDTVGGVTQE